MSYLLEETDPPPFQKLSNTEALPLMFICDHAGKAIPKKLGSLGLSRKQQAMHIAFDIGAREVTELVAKRLKAPAILTNYSRLVIDCNRAQNHPALIPTESDTIIVSGNKNITILERAQRIDEIYTPYQQAVTKALKESEHHFKEASVMLVAIHSFTPHLMEKETRRPWHIGVAWKEDPHSAHKLIAFLQKEGLCVGDNEPYYLKNSYTILENTKQGRPHLFIEIRQDCITRSQQQKKMAEKLVAFFTSNALA